MYKPQEKSNCQSTFRLAIFLNYYYFTEVYKDTRIWNTVCLYNGSPFCVQAVISKAACYYVSISKLYWSYVLIP